MKVLCFGNEFVKEDSLAKELADELKIDGIEFVKCNDPEEITNCTGRVIIMDVVEGLDEVKIFNDIDKIKSQKTISCHDFDLGFHLKLLKELGQIKDIVIIGIPMKGDKEEIKEDIKAAIRKLY